MVLEQILKYVQLVTLKNTYYTSSSTILLVSSFIYYSHGPNLYVHEFVQTQRQYLICSLMLARNTIIVKNRLIYTLFIITIYKIMDKSLY